MKYLLFIFSLSIFILSNNSTFSQRYSKSIKDREIIDFMNFILSKDSLIINRIVNNKQILNSTKQYLVNTPDNVNNIIDKNIQIDSLINEKDEIYFATQIKGQKSIEWNYNFSNTILLNYPKPTRDKVTNTKILDSLNKIYRMVYSYSLPVFTKDKQKAIIIEAFYCGLACGGGSYNLYIKCNDEWKKIKEFNKWGE